jgi:hypothetical protein
VAAPLWLLRKLYRRGSLVQTGARQFQLTLQNPLGDANLVAPPRIVINGLEFAPGAVHAPVDLTAFSAASPYLFARGTSMDVAFEGSLLRGANRIHITVESKEFGELEIFVEDRAIQEPWDAPDKQ